jgi:ribonuclease Z
MNERFFLIDCGEGTQIQLRRFKLSPARINHIFISHLHGDHIFGLFGLLSSLGMMGRRAELHLYGPALLEEIIRTHLNFFGPLPFRICFHFCEDGKVVYEDSKTEVYSLKLIHRTETFGYLFKEKPYKLNVDKEMINRYGLGVEDIKQIKEGKDFRTEDGNLIPNSQLTMAPIRPRTYAYISDTAYMENISELLFGVDLMFHEATFLEEDADLAKQTFHSTARQAAMVAKTAKAGKLLIGHFSTRYKNENCFLMEAKTVFENTTAVNDGDKFTVAQIREEH